MFKEVEVGGKKIPMRATGRTPLYYKQVFHDDLLANIVSDGKSVTLIEAALNPLAYIMAMDGSGADMSKINEDTYAEWLEEFEPFDLPIAGEEIFKVYLSNLDTESTAKKKRSAKQSAN